MMTFSNSEDFMEFIMVIMVMVLMVLISLTDITLIFMLNQSKRKVGVSGRLIGKKNMIPFLPNILNSKTL